MTEKAYLQKFIEAAQRVGAEVVELGSLKDAASYVASKSTGRTLVPETPLAMKHGLSDLMVGAGIEVFAGDFRQAGQEVSAWSDWL